MADVMTSPLAAPPTLTTKLRLGANLFPGGECEFRVWAPKAQRVEVKLQRKGSAAELAEVIPMQREDGCFVLRAPASDGDKYAYIVDGQQPLPDPVSRLLPDGVHGSTQIVDPDSFSWTDRAWRGVPLRDYIIYELHIGTFTPEGTFAAAITKLKYLKDELGMTAIEIMPVAAFPGDRNWGYDGVSLYAVQASYGGPEGLKQLVNAAHEAGLALILDVVYNHLGNEGNYLRNFGPYFTDLHKTPWGDAVNYDAPGAEGVREFVVQNALYWLREYHLDGLRLDAVQTIHDESTKQILAEIKENVADFAREAGREICIIAESDENDSRLVRPPKSGGYGLDAFWSDDFHHCVHTLVTGESAGYYQDFGKLAQLARALREGYVFQGEPFQFWKRPRGTSAAEVPLPANIICIQNHDQVGNRAKGERLTSLCSFAQRQAAAALLLLAPHTPLIFMGQEWDETAPFLFFTSFTDPTLANAVRKGRREEFKDFAWNEVPDPQERETFERSKLNWERKQGENPALDWYKALIKLRKKFVTDADRSCSAESSDGVITMTTPRSEPKLVVIANLSGPKIPALDAEWKILLSAADEKGAVTVATRD
jgi:maltooligosyltrehalose trehalohydrolase